MSRAPLTSQQQRILSNIGELEMSPALSLVSEYWSRVASRATPRGLEHMAPGGSSFSIPIFHSVDEGGYEDGGPQTAV